MTVIADASPRHRRGRSDGRPEYRGDRRDHRPAGGVCLFRSAPGPAPLGGRSDSPPTRPIAFERGVDLWGLPEAQRRAAELILATAGGEIEDAVDVWPVPTHPARIFLRTKRVAQVLGATLSVAAIEKYLVAVGCTVLNKPEDQRLAVDVPGWRLTWWARST